jgi:hypothetical protein
MVRARARRRRLPRALGARIRGDLPAHGARAARLHAGGTGFTILGRSAGGLGYARFSGSRNAFGTVTASTFGGIEPFEMALYGRSGVILGGAAARPSDRRAPSNGTLLDAAVTRGNVTGTYSTRQILVRGVLLQPDRRFGQPAFVTAVAANPAGDAAVTVSYPMLSRKRTTVVGFRNRLFIRPRGSTTFQRKLDYGRQTVGSSPSTLAINGPGDVLLAWDDRKAVRTRLISSEGKIGAEQRLGTGGSPWIGASSTRIVAPIDSTRRMLVAWLAQRAGSSGNAGGPGIVAAAVASPGKSFGRQQTLEANLPRGDGTLISGTAVQAAILRDRSVVTWTGAENRQFVVRTADIVSGRAGASTRLSAAGAQSELQVWPWAPAAARSWSGAATRVRRATTRPRAPPARQHGVRPRRSPALRSTRPQPARSSRQARSPARRSSSSATPSPRTCRLRPSRFPYGSASAPRPDRLRSHGADEPALAPRLAVRLDAGLAVADARPRYELGEPRSGQQPRTHRLGSAQGREAVGRPGVPRDVPPELTDPRSRVTTSLVCGSSSAVAASRHPMTRSVTSSGRNRPVAASRRTASMSLGPSRAGAERDAGGVHLQHGQRRLDLIDDARTCVQCPPGATERQAHDSDHPLAPTSTTRSRRRCGPHRCPCRWPWRSMRAAACVWEAPPAHAPCSMRRPPMRRVAPRLKRRCSVSERGASRCPRRLARRSTRASRPRRVR